MTNLRALIIEMAIELDHNRQCLLDDRRLTHPLADKARAALAEPEPEYPSNKELLELMPETMRDEFSYAARVSSNATGVEPGIFRVALNTAALEYAQAILARWGK